MGIGASLVNISQAGGLNSWIWAEGVDANHDNWAYIMGLFGDLPPQGGTIVFPEQVPLKYPLCVPTGVKFLGTGQTPQAIDAGVPLHLYYGTQFTPTGDWAGASQAGHTTIAAASNGLTLPQTTIALASAAGSAQSPAFTSAGYVLVQTIPVGGPGSYDGGWNLVQYTSIIGNVLQGCTLPFSGNAGASQMFLGLPVVQAQPVTGCTIDAHNVATVVAANSYYPGQPVIVMCNGFTGTYQPASVFEVIAATPTQFQIQLLGNAGGSFSASGSATAPYDTLLCLPNPHATLEALAVVPGTTVNRGVGLGASDWHLRWLFAYQGIVAEVDSDPQSPANTTRGEMTVCYMEQGIGAVGASFICQGNNLRATNLYKTGGILYDMGGACNWLGSHLAGGYPYNTYFGSSSRWAACQWDSLAANGTALLANGGRPSNPGVSLAGCSFFNSVGSMATPLNVPILHNLTSGGQGVTIAGDCVADSSQYGAWSLLSDNPGEADQVLDGFMTSGTCGLGVAVPLFPTTPGSSGLSYPGGYFGSVFCGRGPSTAPTVVRGVIMDKITGDVSVSATTETVILTATVGVGLWDVDAGCCFLATGGVAATTYSADLYISSGAGSGTAVFLMAQSVGVTALSDGATFVQAVTNPAVSLKVTGTISVTTAGTIALCLYSTAAGTAKHLSPTHGLGGVTSIKFTPRGV